MTLKELCAGIRPADAQAAAAAADHWSRVAKPLGSLGVLEEDIVRIAGIQGTEQVKLANKAVAVFCADNGVVAEGVTQTGQEVTAVVAGNMTRGASSVCQMAKVAGAKVLPVDIGMARPVPGTIDRCVRRGTGNIAKEPAMTREEAVQAVLAGAELVAKLKEQGCCLLATGEMGIGNTTTAAAVLSVLLPAQPREVTGRGAGLSTPGLARKVAAIEAAIALHQPDAKDGIDVLCKVGGLDIAGIAGTFLGGAYYHIPVLIDGIISAAGALAAKCICPAAGDYMLASHVSNEPAGERVLAALGVKPVLRAGMCLGEGTGAVAVMPLLDMALGVYYGVPTFEAANIETYTPQV